MSEVPLYVPTRCEVKMVLKLGFRVGVCSLGGEKDRWGGGGTRIPPACVLNGGTFPQRTLVHSEVLFSKSFSRK